MKSKSQISIFLVLGIMLLFVIGVGFYFVAELKNNDIGKIQNLQNLQSSFIPVKNYVQTCLQKSALGGIYFIALQGGYYDKQVIRKEFPPIFVPYYWHGHKSYMPEINIIEQELSAYIKDNLDKCAKGFSDFKNQGYEFRLREPELSSTIDKRGNIIVNLNYPGEVILESSSYRFSTLSEIIDVNFYKIYEVIKQIIDEQQKNPDFMPIGYLSYLALNNNLTFEFLDVEPGEVLYSIILEDGSNSPLVYNFLSKYDWGELNESITDTPYPFIEPIQDMYINESKTIRLQITAVGNELTFYDNTDIFDINPNTGVVEFDSYNLENGEHLILIKAVDNAGKEAYGLMRIVVDYPIRLPVIKRIGKLQASIGQNFSYTVEAYNPIEGYIFFLDDTSLFDINPLNGKIEFVPVLHGNYSIKITAINKEGYSYEIIELEVK